MLRFLPAAPRAAALPVVAGGDDAALVRRVRDGDAQAIDEVYRRESARIYRYALAWCGDAGWAADAMQDAFVALVEASDGFDPDRGSLGAWLAGVARHALLARWRTQRREVLDGESVLDDGETDEAISPEATAADGSAAPDAALTRAQDVERLWQALRQLPLAQCEAVVLVDLQEWPYADAARIGGVDVNTLRTRLHRGRARLWRALREDLPGSRPGHPGAIDDRTPR